MLDEREAELNSIIATGQTKTTNVLSQIQKEFETRQDFIVKSNVMDFEINNKDVRFGVVSEFRDFGKNVINGDRMSFTHFARNQLFNRCKIPVTYADRLLDLGESELLLDNLDIMNNRYNSNGLLIRHIGGKVKGVLSPSYRRMDASPIFLSFVESCTKDGYVPYDGRVTDYRYHVSFILPEVFNPSEGEYIVFGLSITTSDYGASALTVEQIILRITCKNLAIGNDIMRSVHIGKRLNTQEDFVQLSDETHILDSKAVASAVSDVVGNAKKLNDDLRNMILSSMDREVDLKQALENIRKKGFGKAFTEGVGQMYESDLPIKLLPKEKTTWRLSNAISLIAGSQKNEDIALDAQKLAMSVL